MSRQIVVIGAGVGGLSGAVRLARSGFAVTVLEAREEPGGLASEASYDGFSFDAGPYILLDRPGLEWSFEALGLDLTAEVHLIRIDDVYEVESLDGSKVVSYSDVEKTAGGFEEKWSGSANPYKKFVRKMERISRALRPMSQVSRPGALGLIRSGVWVHAPFLARSLAAVLSDSGLPAPIVEAMAIWTHVAGQTKSQAPSPLAFVPALMHSVGPYYPKGGIRCIPQVLEQAAIAAGVRFRYSTKVTRIRTKDCSVLGVETERGEFIPAAALLSNSAALQTYLQLLDSPAPALTKRLATLPLQSPGVCAYLAVRGRVTPPYLAFKLGEGNQRCRLLIRASLFDSQVMDGYVPARLLAPMDYAEAERVGAAGQASYLDQLLEEDWWRRDLDDFRVLAKRTAEQWGTQYHLYANSMNPVMTGKFMRQGRVPHRSPHVRGLYLAGSSTHPGQWVSFCAISGILAADCLIKDLN